MNDDPHPFPSGDDPQRPQSAQNAQELELRHENGNEGDVDGEEVQAIPRVGEIPHQSQPQPLGHHFRHKNGR